MMPAPNVVEESDVLDAYRRAVNLGYVPVGQPVGTGRRSAIWVVAAELRRSHSWVKRKLQKAAPSLFLWPADGRQEIPDDVEGRLMALRGEAGGPPIPPLARPPAGMQVRTNAGEYDKDGNLKRQWVKTGQAGGVDYEIPQGHIVKGESALVDPSGRVLAKWVKTRQAEAAGMAEGFREFFDGYAGLAPAIAAPKAAMGDLLTIYPIPDLHFGMLSWGSETGIDYDITVAAKDAIQSAGSLVSQSMPSRHATVLFLGDYYHQNDAQNATPRSKNILDVDGRWQKIFRAGAELAARLVEQVARKHAEVEVVALPGNHDPDAAICLSVALSFLFKKSPRVKVNESAGLIWYRRFGECLLGGTHGHTMGPDRMAMLLAADRPEDWGATKHRSFFFGHVHRESAREVGGVRVEGFSAAAARDAYAYNAGYRAGRALSAITFHKARGEIGRHRVALPVVTRGKKG